MEPVSLSGVVTRYKGNGRRLGYPTANLTTATDLADGVYFSFASMAEFVNNPAMVFVGVPITVGDSERRVEAYLLDIPDVDYYDQEVQLSIRKFHRPNTKFENIDQLLEAIKADEVAARSWFKEQEKI